MDHPGTQHIDIDGRDNHEESLWWCREEREKNKRPGTGMLPPLLAETLHHPYHPLYSVNFISFPLTPIVPGEQNSTGSSMLSAATGPSFEIQPPSETETRNSVPHPNAYYCPTDNGWVILSWKSSHTIPPLAQAYLDVAEFPLPDLKRRRTPSCISLFGKTLNMTHHFHKYEKAVDGRKLTPPVREDQWKSFENEDDLGDGTLLDLYMCCQCSFYCMASGIIPGVIPRNLMEELVRDRTENPPSGKTGAQAVADAIETIAMYVPKSHFLILPL
jgi:ubiquitin carboxyl-terminal hydrolase 25/28